MPPRIAANYLATEHILILAAPIYMMYSGRYLVLPPSPNMALLSFFVYGFFHSPLLHTCALKSGLNLNYLFTPPPGALFVGIYHVKSKCANSCVSSNSEIPDQTWSNVPGCLVRNGAGRHVCHALLASRRHLVTAAPQGLPRRVTVI